MIVKEYEIPESILQRVEAWIRESKTRGSFTAGDLADRIKDLAQDDGDLKLSGVALRLADRLIQKHRRDRTIERREQAGSRPRWSWK